jgi:hypothetical protein
LEPEARRRERETKVAKVPRLREASARRRRGLVLKPVKARWELPTGVAGVLWAVVTVDGPELPGLDDGALTLEPGDEGGPEVPTVPTGVTATT